jgi:predicted Zn-dependent protease
MDRAFNTSEPSLEDAYYLGRAVAANILAAYRPYIQNPELTRYVNRICQTLAINSSQPVAFKGYYVIILDSPEFNAFATPGGHIFLTRRLVEVTTSEDTLAAVIAHELAHIILKHGLSMITDMSLSNEMSATAGRASDFSGNTPAARRLMNFRGSVTSIIDTMVKNGYSQPQEYAADREAVAILAASGNDPGALVEILAILQRVQRQQIGGFNTTHPTPEQRIANIEAVTRQYRVQDTRSYRVPRFRNR